MVCKHLVKAPEKDTVETRTTKISNLKVFDHQKK